MKHAARPDLLQRLRTETRAAHDALEQDLDWRTRVATPAGYRDLLQRWFGVYKVWEPLAERLVGEPQFLAPRSRIGLLRQDLRQLGQDDAALDALPRFDPGPVASAAAAFGGLYVLEGSSLGGQIVARHIAATQGLDAACAFYRGYGSATGQLWRGFCDRLALVDDAEPVIAVARTTFVRLREWLMDT